MNPASRLHDLLKAFKNRPKDGKLRKAIAEIFNIENESSPDVFKSYFIVIKLAMEVEERLKLIPNINHELYDDSVSSIQKYISTTKIDMALEGFQSGITEKDLHGLKFVADLFDSVESEEEISEEDLKRFENSIDEIRSSGLEPDFSLFLVSHLFLIRTSIQNYRFFGSIGIKASLSQVVGDLIIDPRTTTDDKKKKGLLKKIFEKVTEINAVFVFVRDGKKIVANCIEGVSNLLDVNG